MDKVPKAAPDRKGHQGLPPAALQVITASRELSSLGKLLWARIYLSDRGPEGCFARPDVLAQRIGRSRDRMEDARRELLALGLLHRQQARGRWTDSWFVALPSDCIPRNRRDPEILAAAGRLDEQILTVNPGRICTTRTRRNPGGISTSSFPASPPNPGGEAALSLAASPPPPVKYQEASGEFIEATEPSHGSSPRIENSQRRVSRDAVPPEPTIVVDQTTGRLRRLP